MTESELQTFARAWEVPLDLLLALQLGLDELGGEDWDADRFFHRVMDWHQNALKAASVAGMLEENRRNLASVRSRSQDLLGKCIRGGEVANLFE